MANQDKEAVEPIEFIAKPIVTEPDQVKVTAPDAGHVLEPETTDGDRGRVYDIECDRL